MLELDGGRVAVTIRGGAALTAATRVLHCDKDSTIDWRKGQRVHLGPDTLKAHTVMTSTGCLSVAYYLVPIAAVRFRSR
jgi:hypothetical protein